jgi:hypothetical protein
MKWRVKNVKINLIMINLDESLLDRVCMFVVGNV